MGAHGLVSEHSYILDKVRNRLTGWRANSLSQAGRTVLVQHVLQAIPVHNLIAGWVPRTILSKIESLHRSFLWNNGSRGGLHLVKWNTVVQPKGLGGLGLKDLSLFSTALLGPALYKYLNLVDLPWVRLMRAKYGEPASLFNPASSVRGRSLFWKHCCLSFSQVRDGFVWQLGNGRKTKVLFDTWLFDMPLAFIPTFLSADLDLSDFTVDFFICSTGWDLAKLGYVFHQSLIDIITRFPVALDEDRWVWRFSSSGKARPASVYGFLIGDTQCQANRMAYRSLWKLQVNPKVKHFLWKLLHGALPTCAFLLHRGLVESAACPVCAAPFEDAEHAVFSCPVAAAVWSLYLRQNAHLPVSSMTSDVFWKMVGF